MRTVIAILCSLLLVISAAIHAAEEVPAAETPAPDLSDDQTAEEMLAAEAALEAQEAAAEGGESDVPADTTAAADRPPGSDDEDFVPTIQISEDLSVSFPVDI